MKPSLPTVSNLLECYLVDSAATGLNVKIITSWQHQEASLLLQAVFQVIILVHCFIHSSSVLLTFICCILILHPRVMSSSHLLHSTSVNSCHATLLPQMSDSTTSVHLLGFLSSLLYGCLIPFLMHLFLIPFLMHFILSTGHSSHQSLATASLHNQSSNLNAWSWKLQTDSTSRCQHHGTSSPLFLSLLMRIL